MEKKEEKTFEDHRQLFLQLVKQLDESLLKKNCIPENTYAFLFIYPRRSYVLKTSELILLRKIASNSELWKSSVLLRTSSKYAQL